MHRCLCISELVAKIADHLILRYSNGQPAQLATGIRGQIAGGASCSAMARTCKSFYEPAMDVLWSYLIDFLPLICCFPSDVVSNWVRETSFRPGSAI